MPVIRLPAPLIAASTSETSTHRVMWVAQRSLRPPSDVALESGHAILHFPFVLRIIKNGNVPATVQLASCLDSGTSFLLSMLVSVYECEPGAEYRKSDNRPETQASLPTLEPTLQECCYHRRHLWASPTISMFRSVFFALGEACVLV